MKNFLLFTFFCIFFSSTILAQGTISGTLLDEKYGDPLIGANVVIEGTSIGTSTDFDGKYQFNAAPGTYNIVLSYIGYTDKTISDIVVTDGQVTYLDATLSDQAVDLALGGEEGVVVKAKAINRSENALMMLQKKADKIQDGISSQEMTRYSVSDAAGAMRKVTGVTVVDGKYINVRGLGDRYSLSQLNGLTIPSANPYRNSAQLDLIPSNLLENIITSKTFTPDQAGNFTGGNVNLETKSFPEQKFFTIAVSTAYNAQNNLNGDFLTHSGGKNDFWGYDDGGRSLADFSAEADPKAAAALRFGNNMARLAGNQRFYDAYAAPLGVFDNIADYAATVDRIANSLNTEFTPNAQSMPVDYSTRLSFGNQYNFGDHALGVIFTGAFKKEHQHIEGDVSNYILDDLNDEDLLNQGDYRQTVSTETPTVNGMLGLAYKMGNLNTITTTAIYNHSTDKETRFIFGERPDNLVDPLRLVGRSLAFVERDLRILQVGGKHILPGLNNAKIEWKGSQAISSQLEPDTRFFENDFNTLTNQASIPASDVQRPFHFYRDLEDEQYDAKLDFTIPLANPANKIKFGALYTDKSRAFNENRFQVESTSNARPFSGDPDVYLSADNYGLLEGSETEIGVFAVNRTQPKNAYTGSDKVTAFYGMGTYNVNERLKVTGGARYEKTEILVESGDTTLAAGRIDDYDILPAANLVYSLTSAMNLRGSYSQTVARPNMREISAFEAFDPLMKRTVRGNTDLKRTNITNYDLRWEWFPKAGEIIALSGFYKDFKNPIVNSYERESNPTTRFTNVDNANLYGVEIEFRKDLGVIAPALSKFKVNTNITLIKSSADVAIDPAFDGIAYTSRPFEGQSPFIVNASLIYSDLDQGLDATLSLNSVGDRLKYIGQDINPDVYSIGRNQLDFNISKRFGDLTLRLSAKNILNDRFTEAATNDRLDGSGDGLDYNYVDYTRGVTFGLKASYTIR